MPYNILFQRDAKTDWETACADYGTKFREDTTAWFAELAVKAEASDYSFSFDLVDLIDVAMKAEKNSWAHSLKRFLDGNATERFWAFVTFLRTRRPPWELRIASRTFWVVSAFDCPVVAYVEINHLKKAIVFRHFEGFPHQG